MIPPGKIQKDIPLFTLTFTFLFAVWLIIDFPDYLTSSTCSCIIQNRVSVSVYINFLLKTEQKTVYC